MKPSTNVPNRPRRRGISAGGDSTTGVATMRMFALDHAARDIVGNGIDHHGHVVGFGEHDAAEAGVLHEAVDPLVASHQDVRDDVNPQPRRFALADAAIEQVDLFRHLREQRIERLVQDFQPGDLGIPQFDDDAGAIGSLDPRLAQGVAQPHWTHVAGLIGGIWRV